MSTTGKGSCSCVVGLQWGDEAKGKIVDLLAEKADFVVRYNGGANAGHTVVHSGKKFKLSLLPTGVLRPDLCSVIGNGVVVDPEQLEKEVKQLREGGISVGTNLVVSNHAHLIFPYHREEEKLVEEGGGEGTIGTTRRGIGPCYQDKVGRMYGIRVGELLYPDQLRRQLRRIVPHKNRVLRALSPQAEQFDSDKLCEQFLAYGERLRPHIQDSTHLLLKGFKAGKHILFEAAQGSLLDIDHGTFPFVTSSNSSTTGVWSGSGVPARYLSKVIGVIKAYSTRVGMGPFPTELKDDLGERIRRAGNEYGTVTGRPRRCGWFDAVAVRYTAAVSGADQLALMLLDVLSGLPELKVCVAYNLDGSRIEQFPTDAFLLDRCQPIYETLPAWSESITGVRRYEQLPASARRYVERLSELLELPVSVVSVGPDREQTIMRG